MEELNKKYIKKLKFNIADENTVYSVKPEFMIKYKNTLQNLVNNCDKIAQKDKDFMNTKKSINIKSDALDFALESGVKIEEFLSDIEPSMYTKKPKVS